jgi:hypothetical protein
MAYFKNISNWHVLFSVYNKDEWNDHSLHLVHTGADVGIFNISFIWLGVFGNTDVLYVSE